MKKLIIILVPLAFVVFGCKKDTTTGVSGCKDPNSLNYNAQATVDNGSCTYPDQIQRALFLDYTSSYCHFCGGWGHDSFHYYINEFKNSIIPISVHSGVTGYIDPMTVMSLYNSFNSERPGGLPALWVNETQQTYGSFYPSFMTTFAQTPSLGVILSSNVVGDSMVIKTVTKTFPGSPPYAKYYINVYILESDIPGGSNLTTAYRQSLDVLNNNYTHDYTLRTAANTTYYYGYLLAQGSITSPILENTYFKKNFTIALDPSWNRANLQVCAGIYMYLAYNSHKFINGYMSY